MNLAQVELNTPAPDFSLNDFNGKKVQLSDYKTQKNVVIVLNRGFIWPFCRRQLSQLRQDYEKFEQLDAEIISVGPENADSFKKYWEKENLPYIGLPDEKHSVLDLYGQQVNLFKLGRQPAQMIIDKKGVLRYVHYGHSMKDIPDNKELLKLIADLWKGSLNEIITPPASMLLLPENLTVEAFWRGNPFPLLRSWRYAIQKITIQG